MARDRAKQRALAIARGICRDCCLRRARKGKRTCKRCCVARSARRKEQRKGTLIEAVTYFADLHRAHEHFVTLRWPNGMACPRTGCGSADDIRSFTSGKRKRFRCMECKRDFTAKVGTIFEDSPLGLDKWLPAVWLLANAKNGISSCELARSLGVTQKTAWFMLHRIRVAMRLGSFEEPLSGRVEADETPR